MAVTAVLAGGCGDATWRVHGQSVATPVEVAWKVTGLHPDRHGGEIPAKESREIPPLLPTFRDLFPDGVSREESPS
jgi:hypothetical protein